MENIKVFVTRIPENAYECPFYQSTGSYYCRYCQLKGGAECKLKEGEPCDMLEQGMKIQDMRY